MSNTGPGIAAIGEIIGGAGREGEGGIALREKILLVDDDLQLLAGLQRRLSGRFSLILAGSADEALRALETISGIGVIAAAAQMPGSAGLALLSQVRARWPEIRRVLLTASADHEATAAADDGRLFRSFRKPVDADMLAEALEDAIAEYRFATGPLAPAHAPEAAAGSAEPTGPSFLVMINHELRTPLNHILGFSALLEQRCKQKGEVESLEYLAYIRESGQTLLHTINRVLEIIRLSAKDFQPDRAIFDFAGVIRAEIEHHRPQAAKRGITIAFDAPAEPLRLETAGPELAQAFAELLDNAIQFNRPGGHVSIAVNCKADGLAIRVADTGTGMTETQVSKITQAFRQTGDGASRRYDGTGVGLALAALTAQAYGGSLTVESRKDHGTAVVMRLKRAAVARVTAKTA